MNALAKSPDGRIAINLFMALLSGAHKNKLREELVNDSIVITGREFVEFEWQASLWYARHFLARPAKPWWRYILVF